MAGAIVGLESEDRGVYTDADGRFEIPGVPAGRRTVVAEGMGYERASLRVDVEPGGTAVEVRLRPDPVLLRGLEVVSDRFESRRKATPTAVAAFDREDLLGTGAFTDVLDFIEARAGVPMVPCSPRSRNFHCVLLRGRRRAPTVYIDEAPAVAGLDQLEAYRPEDLYMVEVFARGAHIRAYTHGFMARAAERRLHPVPLFF